MSEVNKNSNTALRVIINESVPEELQEFACKYWSYEGDIENHNWTFTQKSIEVEGWFGCSRFLAGAGAVATLTGYSCATCGAELKCTTRESVKNALNNKSVKCRSCQPGFAKQVSDVLDPEVQKERASEHARKMKDEEARKAHLQKSETLQLDRRAKIVYLSDNNEWQNLLQDFNAARIEAKFGMLLYLRKGTELRSVDQGSVDRYYFNQAWNAGLLKVGPKAPLKSFCWRDETSSEVLSVGDCSVFTGPALSRLYEISSVYHRERDVAASMLLNELSMAGREKFEQFILDLIEREAQDALLCYVDRKTNSLRPRFAYEVDAATLISDEFKLMAREAFKKSSLREIINAVNAASYYVFKDWERDWRRFYNSSFASEIIGRAIVNLRRILDGERRFLHTGHDTASHIFSNALRAVCVDALELNPLDEGFMYQSVLEKWSTLDLSAEGGVEGVTISDDLLLVTRAYAEAYNVSFSNVIERALL